MKSSKESWKHLEREMKLLQCRGCKAQVKAAGAKAGTGEDGAIFIG
jgi:hypothetical protein